MRTNNTRTTKPLNQHKLMDTDDLEPIDPITGNPNTKWHTCITCGDDVHEQRWNLGHYTCLFCGEADAQAARRSWCVVQEYGKGPYQFITSAAAPTTLKQTNQKALRD